jgi:hypothetical protein
VAWPALVFGWPAVIVAITAFGLAFGLKRPWLAVVGAVVATPFCLFVSGYPVPIGRLGGPIALAANFAAVWCLRSGRRGVALALLIPFVSVAAVIASR